LFFTILVQFQGLWEGLNTRLAGNVQFGMGLLVEVGRTGL
jgi:hypothetical protein